MSFYHSYKCKIYDYNQIIALKGGKKRESAYQLVDSSDISFRGITSKLSNRAIYEYSGNETNDKYLNKANAETRSLLKNSI